MAVRVFEYTVSEDSIAASSMAQGGVQGEHNATQVVFRLSESLVGKLNEIKKDGKTFCYRFDRYDGAGGMKATDPMEFSPDDKMTFTHSIEQWQTRYGGTIQIFFVITLNDGDETELELYSYCVKLMLKSLPNAEEVDGENYESISTLAMSVKSNTKIVEEATKIAIEACEKTELARAALESNSEWIFDGGDASGAVEIDMVVDSEMSDTSNNAVANKAIKNYIDSSIAEVDEKLAPVVDYIVETGIYGIWTYRKWNSGNADLWGMATLDVFGDTRHIYKWVSLPFAFTNTPIVETTINRGASETFRQGAMATYIYEIGDSSIKLTMIKDSGGITSDNTAEVGVSIKGRWKE